jgi:hypothetical protein
MNKLMSVKNETQVMRVPSQKVIDLATIAIKDKVSSSKSLFLNLSKHTCFMIKEGKNQCSFLSQIHH